MPILLPNEMKAYWNPSLRIPVFHSPYSTQSGIMAQMAVLKPEKKNWDKAENTQKGIGDVFGLKKYNPIMVIPVPSAKIEAAHPLLFVHLNIHGKQAAPMMDGTMIASEYKENKLALPST